MKCIPDAAPISGPSIALAVYLLECLPANRTYAATLRQAWAMRAPVPEAPASMAADKWSCWHRQHAL